MGTYGQFGLGTAAVLGNTGWLGYARVDYRTGENIEGWNVNAGLRYQFSPEPARGSIKDIRRLLPGPNIIGRVPISAGLLAGPSDVEDWFTPTLGTSDKPEFGGYLFGGQAGYNVQVGRVVVGIEGDYGFANAKGGRSCTPIFPGDTSQFLFTCEAEMDRLALLTGRLGYTWQRALFYVKGGLAVGQATVQTSVNTSTVPLFFTGVPFLTPPVNGETKWLTGWTLGGGMEFALTDKWSAKAEYMHYDLGSERFAIDPPNVADAVDQREHGPRWRELPLSRDERGCAAQVADLAATYHAGPEPCGIPARNFPLSGVPGVCSPRRRVARVARLPRKRVCQPDDGLSHAPRRLILPVAGRAAFALVFKCCGVLRCVPCCVGPMTRAWQSEARGAGARAHFLAARRWRQGSWAHPEPGRSARMILPLP